MVTFAQEPAFESFPLPEANDYEFADTGTMPDDQELGTVHRLIPRETVHHACLSFMMETTTTLDTLGLLPASVGIGNNYFEGLKDGDYLFHGTEEAELATGLMDIIAGAAASRADRPDQDTQLKDLREEAMTLLFQVQALVPEDVVKKELAAHCEELSRTENSIFRDRKKHEDESHIRSESARNKFISWLNNSTKRAYYLQCVAYELRK
ncbi:MAG TPA: hypothetical protein VFN31_02935 [Candidatus Saccharimonadales bacterium]|nr:hypothetical protein [Candidatus Saccharimonadales bacterium]